MIKDQLQRVLDREDEWNFPGGKQEKGETPKECAIREVEEEVGVHVHALTEIVQGDFRFGEDQWHGHFYVAESVSGIPTMREMDKIRGNRFIHRL